MRSIKAKLLTAAALAGLCSPAWSSAITINYDDFSDVSEIQLNGHTAGLTTNSDNTLRLTQGYGQAGSAFFLEPISLLNEASFSAFFSFRIFDNVSGGADGLVFTLQPNSNTAGTGGGGIGFEGIQNSLGVEFDTYDNGPVDGYNGNHVGVNINGNTSSLYRVNELASWNDGSLWNVWVDYDGLSDNFEVRYSQDETRPEFAKISETMDLESLFGTDQLFVGFTSGTGAAGSTHDITRFSFNNTFQPIQEPSQPTSVSEPSVIALMGLALVGMGAARRRKTKQA